MFASVIFEDDFDRHTFKELLLRQLLKDIEIDPQIEFWEEDV